MIHKHNKNDSIWHSAVYVGKEYNDGLYHWKYIKRYKKNGKWVYEYGKQTAAYKAYKDAKDGRGINDRAKDYEAKMLEAATGSAGAGVSRRIAGERQDYEQYYKNDQSQKLNSTLAKVYEKERDKASSLEYKMAYNITKLVESSKKQINKGKKFLSKLFKK